MSSKRAERHGRMAMQCGVLLALAWVLAPTRAAANANSPEPKLEYWAFRWGTLIMGLSGFLLWFNHFSLRHFPKWITDAATAVHWYEALLATFSILIWHFYLVIFDPLVYPMDTVWLDGKISADHYRHARPAYYRELSRAGLLETPDESEDLEPSAEPAHGDDQRRVRLNAPPADAPSILK